MHPIRVHIITHQSILDKKKNSVQGWRLELENIGAIDALRIAYVLQYNSDGSAELFRVRSCICQKARQFSGRADSFTLDLGAQRGIRKESVDALFEGFETGVDLRSDFVQQLESYLAVGHEVADEPEAQTPGVKTMTFAEAKSAVAEYYGVDKNQVQIRIIG